MTIAAQLPPIPPGQPGAALSTLAQAAGQTVEARVIGQTSDGLTQARIGQQTVTLSLPAAAQIPGSVLSLAVRQAEGQLQLTLLSITAPSAALSGSSGNTTDPAAPNNPATTIDLSSGGRAAQQSDSLAAQSASAAQIGRADVAAASGATSNVRGAAMGGQGAAASATSIAGALRGVMDTAAIPASAVPAPATPGGAASFGLRPDIVPGAAAPATTVGSTTTAIAAAVAPPRPAIPYAVAAPAIYSGAAVEAVTGVPEGPATVSSSTGLAAQGQRTSVTSGSPSPSGQPAIQTASAVASSVHTVLAQMVQEALPQQNSVIALTSALSAIVGKTALPEPVLKAAQQVLGQRLVLDKGQVDGTKIQQAIQRSGAFNESLLVSGKGAAAAADGKSALLGLRQTLISWLGARSPVEPLAPVPPPFRGLVPRAKAPSAPTGNMPSDPIDAGKLLLDRTEAALSRLRLHQNASLPDGAPKPETQLSLDLPVVAAGQQALLHLQIHGDAEGNEQEASGRGWQVRFAINLSGMGEVGAQITLRGRASGVLIWTDNPDTALALEREVDALRAELGAAGLHAGSIVVRGTPPQQAAAPSGQYLDEQR